MAATENSQMCLEKRNIQRSSDGTPLRSVHWGMNVLFAKKSQHNTSGPDKRFSQKTSERVTETKCHPKSVLKESKSHQKSASSEENQAVRCDLGSFPADGAARGEPEEDARHGNNALGRLICSRFERRDSLAGCEGRRTPRGGGTPGVGRAKETRITSLCKLLNAPLAAARAPAPDLPEGGDAKESSDTPREDTPLPAAHTASPRSRSADAQPEAAAMNGEIKHHLKSHRKRAAKSVESVLNAACHDEVKEKIAELARMPRIKSLDEILESLHIKVDPKTGVEAEIANEACSSEKCCANEECCLSGKLRTVFHDGLSGESQKLQSSAFDLEPKGNDSGQQTPQQSANRKEERCADSKKHIKVIISGEVSRKPRPTYVSKAGSENSRECSNISYLSKAKSSSQGVLATRNTEFEDAKKCDWKTNKKLHSVLARKRQVNNTKELKAILQARTSYRKEVPSSRNSASGLNTSEVPCKKRRLGPNDALYLSPSEERQCNYGTTFETVSLDEDYPNSDFQKDTNAGSSTSNDIFFLGNVNDGCDVPYSPVVSESDLYSTEGTIDEVKNILKQLPPLNVTDISWTESQDCEPKVKSTEDIQYLVDRMQKEHLEGVNGNYNNGTISNLFREWHETVVRPSYEGSPLTLLPFVVID